MPLIATLIITVLISTFALLTGRCPAVPPTDLIEFAGVKQAKQFGWRPDPRTRVTIASDAPAGKFALKIEAETGATPYRGIELWHALDLSAAGPRDKLLLHVNQNFSTGMVIQLWTEQGNVHRAFAVKHDGWSRVELDMDLKNWENPHGLTSWSKVSHIQFYANAFDSAGERMILDGFHVTAGGKPVRPEQAESIVTWKFPQETATSWRLGDDQTAWAISKSSGQVVGGWNAKTKECYLLSVEGRYHMEDRKSLVTALASQDVVTDSRYSAGEQRIELTCSNKTVPDLIINKQYWLRDNKLFQKTAFKTKSSELQFITYNNQAVFEQSYRDAGYYMGGGDGGFPLLPAPRITAWQKVLEYQNTTKGMVLSQPEKQHSFAHVRTRLDETFVWPWFTGAIASYCEAQNVLHYTPDGWDMSLGTSILSSERETSYEQYFSIFEGNWFNFLSHEYPSMPEVKEAYEQIPPTPAWVADVKADTFSDIHKLKHLLEMTDEGTIMVLVDFGGSWADYYVDQGLQGGWAGGSISADEIKDLIARIKSLSPRIKVGIYMWQLSTLQTTRIYQKNPEWFRSTNKQGEQLSTFPGVVTNFAHLLSIPECYNELLSQFDLILGTLDTDFIYLDDPKAINPIDWKSGQFTRDDLSYRYLLDIKKIAAKHGPDKMVFFNNRCNPYADVNYIEARGQMNPEYWRVFAGIATIAETNLNANPAARIVPLYYTTPYQREYVNRVLAVGWIPEASSANATELLERRAFFQAAYEIGNCGIVPARYSPDWKREKDAQIESYPMQRNGDEGHLFSFISHQPEAGNVPIELDLSSLKLDPAAQVFVWRYVVENGLDFKGRVTERLARQVYGETRWQLDRVTRRQLLYAGPYSEKLALDVEMQPLELNQLYVTSQTSVVYSENNLAGNYLFNRMPKVTLREKADWKNGVIDIEIESDREQTEILASLAMSAYHLDRAELDGQAAEVDFVWENNDVFPLITVARGKHTLSLHFSPESAGEPIVVDDLRVGDESESYLNIALDGYETALLTLSKNGRILFNRMVNRAEGGDLILPLAAGRGDAGEFDMRLRAVMDGRGKLHPVAATPVKIRLNEAQPQNNLPPLQPPILPGKREIAEINREIRGVKVLNTAIMITDTMRSTFQPDMPALMAVARPDELMLEAGTTSKIDYITRGAAFAGYEIENLRKLQVRLSNTFYDAFHVFGEGIHTPPWNTSSSYFAGLVVDYHTPAGYAKRVHFPVGVRHPECSSVFPDYGKTGVADAAFDLGQSLLQTPQSTFALDLAPYAPDGWDGRVWLSVGSDWMASDRRLKLEILAFNSDVTGEFLAPADPKAFAQGYAKPKTLRVPRSPGGILIDGVANEEMWRGAAKAGQFYLNGGKGVSRAQTEALVLYDETQLYVAFTCAEPQRHRPLIQGGAVWDDDEIEVWIDPDGAGKNYRQVLINGNNDKAEFSSAGPTPIGVISAVHVSEGQYWSVEMTIPYKGLGVEPPQTGEQWRISLCRYRPAGNGFNDEQIVWAPLKGVGFKDLENFGTLTFR